jgi:hypothetical protein
MAREPIDPRFVAAALVLIAFACLGLWHVETGRWRPGPGGGPALVPWLAFWSILPAALVMLWAGLRRPEDARTEAVKLLPVAGAVIWGLVYFWMVRKLGLVVSTVLMLGVGMIGVGTLQELKILPPCMCQSLTNGLSTMDRSCHLKLSSVNTTVVAGSSTNRVSLNFNKFPPSWSHDS